MIGRYARRVFVAGVVAAVSALALAAIGEKKAKGPFADADPDVAAIAEAAVSGDCALIDKLVARKVNVNAQGKEGISPLVYCLRTGRRAGLDMRAGNIKGFERLLVHGADPNLRDDSGDAAIHYAAALSENGPEFLKIALAHGGDPNLHTRPKGPLPKEDINGVPITYIDYEPTPIFDAIVLGNTESMRILLKAGADLKVRNSLGQTPLASAAMDSRYECVLLLLEAGADFRVKDNDGLPFSHFFTDKEVYPLDPTTRFAAIKRRCKEFMEKKGVDFAKEKIENEKIHKQIEERRQREDDDIVKRLKQREKLKQKGRSA